MAFLYRVRLTSGFRNEVQSWPDSDQDILQGLAEAFGYDVIGGAATSLVDGLTVEFIEPGETPEMVWAQLYLELNKGLVRLRLHRRGDEFVLDRS